MLPAHLNDAQRAFVRATESAGATSPAAARPLASLPRLSAGELDELVDLGLVREAADGAYYAYQSRGARAMLAGRASPYDAPAPDRPAWLTARRLRAVAFWLVIILVPLVFLRLSAPRPAGPSAPAGAVR